MPLGERLDFKVHRVVIPIDQPPQELFKPPLAVAFGALDDVRPMPYLEPSVPAVSLALRQYLPQILGQRRMLAPYVRFITANSSSETV